MGSIIGLLIGKSIFGHVIGEKAARVIAIGGLFLTLLAVLGGVKCAYDRNIIRNHEQKIERRATPATDKAADERARDTINQSKSEQEAHDAIKAQPDQPIAPTSRALACKRLRDAGKHPPACR